MFPPSVFDDLLSCPHAPAISLPKVRLVVADMPCFLSSSQNSDCFCFVDKIRDMTNLILDVHLMVENPDSVIEDYAKAGADVLTIHAEACKNPTETLKKIKANNMVAGLAINPKTPALKIKDLLESGLVDIVTVMSVKPGAYGQKFIPGSAEKVAEIREMDKKIYIEIDGGVTTKNAPILRKLGVNIIVSGSTIFESKNMKRTIRQLKGKGTISNLIKSL